jgi:adenylate cyclase class 2
MEIEIKAKCFESTFSHIREKLLKLKAKKKGEKTQIDQYYNLPHIDLRGTNKYIRLRKEGESTTFAYHENIGKGLTNDFETKMDNGAAFKQILDKFGFRELGVIEKSREFFELDNYSICLDRVKGVGTFISIETHGEKKDWQKKKKGCIGILKKIGLDESAITNEYLCEIATKH